MVDISLRSCAPGTGRNVSSAYRLPYPTDTYYFVSFIIDPDAEFIEILQKCVLSWVEVGLDRTSTCGRGVPCQGLDKSCA